MTRELQSTLDATRIEWHALRHHIPIMAHGMRLAPGAVMGSLGVTDRAKSWDTHERDQRF